MINGCPLRAFLPDVCVCRDLRLKNPVNDARALHAALVRLGYDSALCVDPRDMDTVNTHLDAFASKLQGTTGLIFFAGHGTQNSKKETYLLTLKEVTHELHLDNCASHANAAYTAVDK